MPRTARFLQDDVCYHIMARGNRKQEIFKCDSDYKYYGRLLKGYKSRFDMAIYAFCFMPNHVHLILQPAETHMLPLFMKSLNQSYAQYFNSKYEKSGHLWQGRFKSMVIAQENYLFDCIKYVEFNPVRSNLAQSPTDYPWSSCRLRIRGIKSPILDSFKSILWGTSGQMTKRDTPKLERGTVPSGVKGLSLDDGAAPLTK